MRRLIVMRHAKSDWDAGVGDHQRPLNGRGRRSAEAIGELLARIGEVPDVAYTSSAERARDTLERAVLAGGWETEVHERQSLYLTSVGGALEVLGKAPSSAQRVMLVGHQPTWGQLVEHLTGGRVAVKTATVVGIDLEREDWGRAELGASIAYVLQPRLFLDGD